jgi:hypothetical protein
LIQILPQFNKENPIASAIINREKLKAVLLRSVIMQGYSVLLHLINTVLEIQGRGFRQAKQIKGIQIGKEEVHLSLFAGDMLLFVESPKDL